MGQKSSPAAELIMEDAFIPDELQIGLTGKGGYYVSIYLAASRGPVGAIGTGIARRALEGLIEWAKQKKIRGSLMIDQQSLQVTIARMAKEIILARQADTSAAVSFDQFMQKIYAHPVAFATMNMIPSPIGKSGFMKKMIARDSVKDFTNRIMDGIFTNEQVSLTSALSTIAKIKGSEVGVEVSSEVMRIMGHDAADPKWQIDKLYRDAKLTQIYEGTNQANSITLYKEIMKLR